MDPSRLEDRLARVLREKHPFAYCDDCVALELQCRAGEAGAAGLALASRGAGFHRERRLCYRCHRTVELTSLA